MFWLYYDNLIKMEQDIFVDYLALHRILDIPGRAWVRRAPLLVEVFRGFPQSRQSNFG
jgi:hypothetical protein